MPDDPKKTGPKDASRVNVHEQYELKYWSEKFAVSPQKLKDAVTKVGPMVKDVQKALGK